MPKYNPCPYCKEQAWIEKRNFKYIGWIHCLKCNAQGPFGDLEGGDFIDKWNEVSNAVHKRDLSVEEFEKNIKGACDRTIQRIADAMPQSKP